MRRESELGSTLTVDGRIRLDARRLVADQQWSIYVGLVVLNVLDVVTTTMVLDRGGSERNPFVQPFVDGMWDVALMKALVLVFIAVMLMRCRESRMVETALAVTTGWYLAVVMWNLTVLALL